MADRRLTQLDSLRGIAALIVLLHHCFLSAGLMTGRFRAALVASPVRPIDNGRPAVLFFVLSGFVLVRSLRGRAAALGALCVAAAPLAAQLFYRTVERPAHQVARSIGRRRPAPMQVTG